MEHCSEGQPERGIQALTLEQAKMNIGVAQSYFWPRVSLVSSNNRLENSGAAGSTDDLSSRSWSRGVRVNLSLFAGFAALKQSGQVAAFRGHGGSQTPAGQAGADRQRAASVPPVAQGREDLKSAKESITRIETQLKAAEAFVKVGMAPYVNVLQNQVELSKAKQQEIRVQTPSSNAEVS